MAAYLIILGVIVSTAACNPSEEDARAWYAERKASVAAIDREVRAHAPREKPDCARHADSAACTATWNAHLAEDRKRLADEVLPALLDSSGALGIEVFEPEGEIWSGRGMAIARAGESVNSLTKGTSEPAGLEVDGRWLGWGEYWVAASEASKEPVKGFTAAWMVAPAEAGKMRLRVRVLFAAP